jgi:hypothetical protein
MAKRGAASKSKPVSKQRRKPAPAGTKRRAQSSNLRTKVAKFMGKIWADPELRARFRADPKSVLKENGLYAPTGVNIAVVEDTKDTIHIVIPQAPEGTTEREWPPDDFHCMTIAKTIQRTINL